MVTNDRPLVVYVVWHPDSEPARALADLLFTSLCTDSDYPARRGLGIPVGFRTSSSPEETPSPIPRDAAERIAVVVLVDAHMLVDSNWRDYVTSLGRQTPEMLVIPAALTPASHLPPELKALRAIALADVPEGDRETELLNRVMHGLAGYLDPGSRAVKVFISHTRRDDPGITQSVRRHFNEVAYLDHFFDDAHIPHGSRLAEAVTEAAGTALALLAIQTDNYSDREWCRVEVLEAKRRGVPIVVLDAVQAGELRSFPYLGNGPVIRWNGESTLPAVVGALLREVLRTRYFPQRVKSLCRRHGLDPEHQVFAYPPEIYTAVMHRNEATDAGRPVGPYLYPDPPLGTEELDLIRAAVSDLQPVTPTTLSALSAWPDPFPGAGSPSDAAASRTSARGRPERVVGLSVADPPDDELIRLGLSLLHLRQTFVELARHVFAAGWSVAYGGDLRQSGYTEVLFDLVRTHKRDDRPAPDRVVTYLAWPHWVGRTPDEDIPLTNVATLVRCAEPPAAPPNLPPSQDRGPGELLFGALGLTQMRTEMTAGIDSRVVLGGDVAGQAGFYPGIVEEALFAAQRGVPLFVAGGFGGAGRIVADALDGVDPPELTVDYQLEHTPRYGELLEAARSRGTVPDFDALVSTFRSTGMTGLANGLDEEENRRLTRTDDVDEVVALVLRGLHRLDELVRP